MNPRATFWDLTVGDVLRWHGRRGRAVAVMALLGVGPAVVLGGALGLVGWFVAIEILMLVGALTTPPEIVAFRRRGLPVAFCRNCDLFVTVRHGLRHPRHLVETYEEPS